MKRFFVSMRSHKEVCDQRDELIKERDDAILLSSQYYRTSKANQQNAEAQEKLVNKLKEYSKESVVDRRIADVLVMVEKMQRLADSPRETEGLEKLAKVLKGYPWNDGGQK